MSRIDRKAWKSWRERPALTFTMESRQPPTMHAVDDAGALARTGRVPAICDAACEGRGSMTTYCETCQDKLRLIAIERAAELTEAERLSWLVGPIPGFAPMGRNRWESWELPC